MKQKPIKSMKGEEVMIFVRDGLLDEAARKKGFIEACERVAGGVTPPEDRQRAQVLEAAGEMLELRRRARAGGAAALREETPTGASQTGSGSCRASSGGR